MAQDPAAKVEQLFITLGVQDKVTRVQQNVWALQKGSALVQVIAAPEFVVATAVVRTTLPTQNREQFFAALLQANMTMFGAFFTLENDGSVRVNQVIPIDWLEAPELGFVVGNVANQADAWDDKLKSIS